MYAERERNLFPEKETASAKGAGLGRKEIFLSLRVELFLALLQTLSRE